MAHWLNIYGEGAVFHQLQRRLLGKGMPDGTVQGQLARLQLADNSQDPTPFEKLGGGNAQCPE